eukprot:GHVU01098647.1.p1 GENE.GHVU01098647.1~~GHVU01098647.1.p1  ORF type:complete len:246 (-),score=16.42 GHVU01098647.1:1260-1997(-)
MGDEGQEIPPVVTPTTTTPPCSLNDVVAAVQGLNERAVAAAVDVAQRAIDEVRIDLRRQLETIVRVEEEPQRAGTEAPGHSQRLPSARHVRRRRTHQPGNPDDISDGLVRWVEAPDTSATGSLPPNSGDAAPAPSAGTGSDMVGSMSEARQARFWRHEMPPGQSPEEASLRVDRAVRGACASMPSAVDPLGGTVATAPLPTSCTTRRADEVPFHKRAKIAFFCFTCQFGWGARGSGVSAKGRAGV